MSGTDILLAAATAALFGVVAVFIASSIWRAL